MAHNAYTLHENVVIKQRFMELASANAFCENDVIKCFSQELLQQITDRESGVTKGFCENDVIRRLCHEPRAKSAKVFARLTSLKESIARILPQKQRFSWEWRHCKSSLWELCHVSSDYLVKNLPCQQQHSYRKWRQQTNSLREWHDVRTKHSVLTRMLSTNFCEIKLLARNLPRHHLLDAVSPRVKEVPSRALGITYDPVATTIPDGTFERSPRHIILSLLLTRLKLRAAINGRLELQNKAKSRYFCLEEPKIFRGCSKLRIKSLQTLQKEAKPAKSQKEEKKWENTKNAHS